jgi:hypothetical protein
VNRMLTILADVFKLILDALPIVLPLLASAS